MVKLVTFAPTAGGGAAAPRAGAVVGGGVVDLHAADPRVPASMLELLQGGDAGVTAAAAAAAAGAPVPLESVRLLAPLDNPEKILCAGANYADHVAESIAKQKEGAPKIAGMGKSALDPNGPIPLFNKFNTCIIGAGDAIVKPSITRALDWEVELVIVIGRRCKAVREEEALDYVAGYMVGNDVTARDWQHSAKLNPAKQHFMGKSLDTFAPIGPWLVSRDEIPDPDALDLWLTVNGKKMQSSNTRHLIHGCANIIAYCSRLWTLKPGDMIWTGTPAGVGAARKPPVFLQPGDVVECSVAGLGVLSNPVAAEPPAAKM